MSVSAEPGIYIIEGCVGVGKSVFVHSTLAFAELVFGKGAKVVLIHEEIYGPFLDLYLADQKRLAFPFQTCMARDRIEAMRMAQRHYRKGRVVLIDRGVPGDIAFAKLHHKLGNISNDEMRVYYGMLGHGVPHFIPASLVPKVSCSAATQTANFEASEDDDDLALLALPERAVRIVYLRVDAQIAFARMQKRGNAGEVDSYKLGYFFDLCDAYDETIDAFRRELPTGSVRTVQYNATRRVDETGHMLRKDCLAVWRAVRK